MLGGEAAGGLKSDVTVFSRYNSYSKNALTKEFCTLTTIDYILCTVYCVLCTVYCVLCTVYCVLCTVYCVLCTVYCVLCTVYCVLCTVYCVLCTVRKFTKNKNLSISAN